jgi:carboxypeptidase Q
VKVLLPLLLLLPATAGRRQPPAPSLDEGAALLLEGALGSSEAYEELAFLCDHIGHRLTGSAGLERAVQWAARELEADGLEVTLEPVQVPVWVRGEELVEVLAPLPRRLEALTLGGSVGTGPEGIEGELMVVGSFEELEQRGAEAEGRIVLFDDPWESYGQAASYRGGGASAAAAHGAIAALVRSPTPVSLGTPHTGGLWYDQAHPSIPAAAVTIEDASWMRRLVEGGETVRLSMTLGAERRGEAPSHNVVGQVTGREHPEQIVVLGCHLDSWDVGQGAQDDGAGCVAVMEAGRLLASLPVAPRRSVRVVLFTNEELGVSGGKAYAAAHGDEVPTIVAALEADTGSGQPLGFGVDLRHPETGERAEDLSQAAVEALQAYTALLEPIGAASLEVGWSGVDISPLVRLGVPGLGVRHDTSGYWPIHHTTADTFDKVDPQLLARNVAAVTLMGWILAESPQPLPRAVAP